MRLCLVWTPKGVAAAADLAKDGGVIEIVPLCGIGEVVAGDDLASMLACALRSANVDPTEGSILVVTQKIVSKAEGRFVQLNNIVPGPEAERLAAAVGKDARLVELVLRESTDVIRVAPNVLITRHRLGLVMANAGIDRSNIGPGSSDRALLLPLDPDDSARKIRDRLCADFGCSLGVVISDSFGRPWRNGVVNVAIGAAGLPALVDRRGLPDRDGRPLEVTQVALGDLIASAAGLAAGEGAEGIAAVLVTGMDLPDGDVAASGLVRPPAEDLFR